MGGAYLCSENMHGMLHCINLLSILLDSLYTHLMVVVIVSWVWLYCSPILVDP